MPRRGTGAYTSDWPEISRAVKDAADWRCARCGHAHDRKTGHVLTCHHLDMDKGNNAWWNVVPLCQRCHLSIQARVVLYRPYVMAPHSEWFKVYAAGYYAHRYLGCNLSRTDVERHLDVLLDVELRAVVLGVPGALMLGELQCSLSR